MIKTIDWITKRLSLLSILSLGLILLSQTLGRVFWVFELFSHFVPYYLLLIFLTFVLVSFKESRTKNKTGIHFSIILMSAFIGLLFWCFMPITKTHSLNNPIAIAYHNININNPNFDTAYQQLSKHNPDLMILIEPNPDKLRVVLKNHQQHQRLCEQLEYSPFSMAILSNGKLINSHCEMFALSNFSIAKIKINNKTIFAIHPPPPINSVMAKARNDYLKALAKLIQKEQGEILVIGDMNVSAFSPVYRDFIKNSQLNRTMANAMPTWLPFGIGIDQILIKNSQANVKALDWKASDHRAFLVAWE